MLISDFIGILKFLANLIGLPFLSVLIGFFILSVELFLLAFLMLLAVWRIRKEMINLNRKIEVLSHPPENGSEIETDKETEKGFGKESKNEIEKEIEAQPGHELGKKKYRYKWK
jgi:hypothetical protein